MKENLLKIWINWSNNDSFDTITQLTKFPLNKILFYKCSNWMDAIANHVQVPTVTNKWNFETQVHYQK